MNTEKENENQMELKEERFQQVIGDAIVNHENYLERLVLLRCSEIYAALNVHTRIG